LQILAERKEQHLHLDADLREREAWVVELILARSEASWDLLAQPTLRFTLPQPTEDMSCHLELGRYRHLAALHDPTPGEQELILSPTPCWARVYPHRERQADGQSGALAQSYVPITMSEAVVALGMREILSALEHAVRAAGSDLRAQAERLRRRHDELVDIEQALGWDDVRSSAPLAAGATVSGSWVTMLLIGQVGRPGRLLGAGVAGIIMTLLCLLFNPLLLLIALPLTVAVFLIWEHMAAA
jgi:hypothetical protein